MNLILSFLKLKDADPFFKIQALEFTRDDRQTSTGLVEQDHWDFHVQH